MCFWVGPRPPRPPPLTPIPRRLCAAPANFDKVVDGSKGALIEFYAPW